MAASGAESGSASVPSPIYCAIGSSSARWSIGGAVHRGEHEPIVDRPLFDAVQKKLATSATARELRLKASPALLAGRIFDDRGNRMTPPTHTNKRGARYRYYVSHAIIQTAGGRERHPRAAPEVESAIVNAVREHFKGGLKGENDNTSRRSPSHRAPCGTNHHEVECG